MSFLSDLNAFLTTNSWVMFSILAFTILFAIGLFAVAFMHAWRGNKHSFPLTISASFIIVVVVYIPYAYKTFHD
jgi:ABC-type proline/glycine betaine transport system permease subunit